MTGDGTEIDDGAPPDWDGRQIKHGSSFLQSSQWAAFQRHLGRQPHFLSGKGWSCLLIERRTPLGAYLFAPYGPTLSSQSALRPAVSQLKTYAKRQGFDWVTVEPMVAGEGSEKLRKRLQGLGALQSSHLHEPDLTRIVDLSLSEEDLLASISQSTRSYIRKNNREELMTFRSSVSPDDMEIFIKMLAAVTDRNKVFFFPADYFRTQASSLMPADMLHLEMAYQGGKPMASAIIIDYGRNSSYTFAASLPEARKTNASALLLWQTMLNAKRRGQQQLDLFGIAPEDAAASHPWHGFSAFKKKFGGQVVAYAGTWDLPLSYKYWLYRAAQQARQLIR